MCVCVRTRAHTRTGCVCVYVSECGLQCQGSKLEDVSTLYESVNHRFCPLHTFTVITFPFPQLIGLLDVFTSARDYDDFKDVYV